MCTFYDPGIPFLGIKPRETLPSPENIYKRILGSTLWAQTGKWIKKVVHSYHKDYTAVKMKSKIPWMNPTNKAEQKKKSQK